MIHPEENRRIRFFMTLFTRICRQSAITCMFCLFFGISVAYPDAAMKQEVQSGNARGGLLENQLEGYRETHQGLKNISGSLLPDTRILMHDGTEIALETIHTGDWIVNPATGKAVEVQSVIRKHEDSTLYELRTDETGIRLTAEHPVLLESGIQPAATIKSGDTVIGQDGKRLRVWSLEKLPMQENSIVYSLLLKTDSKRLLDHLLIANGIVVGDSWVQKQIQ